MKNLMVLGLIAAIALPAQATINVGTRLMYGGFISKWEPVNDLRDPGKAPASTARVISGETELLLSNHSIKQASDPIQSIRLIPNRPGSPEFNLTHKLNPWSRDQSYIAADERGSIFPYIQGGRLGIHPNVMKHFNEYFANLSRKPVTLFLDIRFESGSYARYDFQN
ncbi:MAG TPA: hypothetical protein PKC28_08095 [Bdellovibrionales bacterium]|nr:hypothetical protein [Bdellovibrionales bacterium]